MGASCRIGNTSCESDVPRSHILSIALLFQQQKNSIQLNGRAVPIDYSNNPITFLRSGPWNFNSIPAREIFFLSFSGHFPFSFIHFGPFWWTDVDESCKYKRSEKHWKYRFSPSHRGLQHILEETSLSMVVCVLHRFPFKTCAILLSSHQSY